jgi:transglutaminase-like putative cysteine protease
VNQRKHLTLVAAAAAILSALPLSTVFERWTWLIDGFLLVAVLCGVALLVRSLRAPSWAPTVAQVVAGLLLLTWLFPSKDEVLGILPGVATFQHFNELLTTAATEMSQFAAPVEDRTGFLFLTTLGIGAVALVVDLFAVVLRRPALAGLPMLAIYSVPVAVSEGSVNIIPFVLGAAGFLWLLVTDNVDRVRRFGRRFTGDGRDVDLWEPSPLAAAGQRLGLIGLVLAVVLPLAVPNMTNGLLASIGSGTGIGLSGPGTGRSVSFNAVLSGELNRDGKTDMLKVTNVDDPAPLYIRFGVADDLRPDGFFNRQLPAGTPVNSGLPGAGLDKGIKTATYKANIEVLSLDMPYLPVYVYPSKINKVSNNWLFDKNTTTVYSTKETTKKKNYTLEYTRPIFNPEDLRKVQPLDDGNPLKRQYSTAPEVDYVRDLVDELTKGKATQYDRVMSLFNHFSTGNGFQYDTQAGSETGGDKIVSFLQNKRGFCVQYAAALGWLVRQAGIPARVAFGFTRGGRASGDKTMVLTNNNLHAWTEIYFQGYGWLPFDATPATSVGGSVSPDWAPNPSAPNQNGGPNVDGRDNRDDPGATTSAPAPNSSNNAARALPDSNTPGTTPQEDDHFLWILDRTTAGYLAGVLALMLLALAPALARRRLRGKRMRFAPPPAVSTGPSGGPGAPPGSGPAGVPAAPGEMRVLPENDPVYLAARHDAHQAWDELLDTMIDYKVPIDEAETPRATVLRLVTKERLRDDAEASIRLLSTAEEHARYARRPITGRELRSAVGTVRKAFASRAAARTRFMAVMLPPSVTQRWRSNSWRRFAGVVNAVGRRRDSAVRTLSVRRLVTRKAR